MKGVDTIARVRREHFVRGRSIKEISRDLNLSRNKVRKILRNGESDTLVSLRVCAADQGIPEVRPRLRGQPSHRCFQMAPQP